MDQTKIFKIVQQYISFVKKNGFEIQKAYIFGSYAKGNFNEDSDIDLALVFKGLHKSFDMQIRLMKLRRKIDLRIEPHPFDESDFNTSNPFANEIITTGRKIL